MRVDQPRYAFALANMDGSDDAPALPGSTRAVSLELVNDGAAGRSNSYDFRSGIILRTGLDNCGYDSRFGDIGSGTIGSIHGGSCHSADADAGLIEDSTLVAVPRMT